MNNNININTHTNNINNVNNTQTGMAGVFSELLSLNRKLKKIDKSLENNGKNKYKSNNNSYTPSLDDILKARGSLKKANINTTNND